MREEHTCQFLHKLLFASIAYEIVFERVIRKGENIKSCIMHKKINQSERESFISFLLK